MIILALIIDMNSAQVIPRQGVETPLISLLLSFPDLSTGDSPTGGGNIKNFSKTTSLPSAQVIPRQGVET